MDAEDRRGKKQTCSSPRKVIVVEAQCGADWFQPAAKRTPRAVSRGTNIFGQASNGTSSYHSRCEDTSVGRNTLNEHTCRASAVRCLCFVLRVVFCCGLCSRERERGRRGRPVSLTHALLVTPLSVDSGWVDRRWGRKPMFRQFTGPISTDSASIVGH